MSKRQRSAQRLRAQPLPEDIQEFSWEDAAITLSQTYRLSPAATVITLLPIWQAGNRRGLQGEELYNFALSAFGRQLNRQ